MIKSIIAVLGYVLSRVLFVGVMVGLPTVLVYLPKVIFNGLNEKDQKKLAINILFGYAVILTGILLAIVLRKVGF